MILDRVQLEYIQNPFGGCCPFCYSGEPNWTGRKVFFHKLCYRCSSCGAEFEAKLDDILSGNYNTAKILIDNAGNSNSVFANYQNCWVAFQQIYDNTILTHHYQMAAPLPESEGFSPSCRLCKNGQNEANGEATVCMRFGFRANPDCICDSYVDGFSGVAKRFLDAINKNSQ